MPFRWSEWLAEHALSSSGALPGPAIAHLLVICCTAVTIGLRSNQSRKEKNEQNVTCSRFGLLRNRVLVSINDVFVNRSASH